MISDTRRWLGEVLHVLVLLGIAGAMAAGSWRLWPDALIDFGREAFVAWRLAEGDVLYRDILYLNGPLSPAFNAAVFGVFGTGLSRLFAVNALWLAGVTALFYTAFRRWPTDPGSRQRAGWGAVLAGGLFLSICAFARYRSFGNYNFLAPYSHETTHGLILSLAAIWLLTSRGEPGLARCAGAGVALGGAFLTKLEVALAGAAGVGAALVAAGIQLGARAVIPRGLALAGGGFTAVAIAFAALARELPLAEAARGVLGSFATALGTNVATMDFYRAGMGILAPATTATWMLYSIAGGLLAAGLAGGVALAVGRWGGAWVRWGPVLGAAGGALAFASVPSSLWFEAPRGLPLLCVGVVVWAGVRLVGAGRHAADPTPWVALLAFAVFALVLQAKIVLNVTFLHYGFALAAPALVLVVWCATVALPDAVARSGGSASVAAWIAAGLVVALGAAHVSRQVEVWSLYETALGAPPDEMRVGPGRGRVLASVVEEIRERTAPGQSVAVFPEGVMLNYLARRPLAVPYFTFTPFDLVVTPEAEILAAFAASPPDLVVLVHRETREYGLPFFGRSYGRSLNTWVRRNYRPVRMIGDPPLRQGSDFGALVMERQP